MDKQDTQKLLQQLGKEAKRRQEVRRGAQAAGEGKRDTDGGGVVTVVNQPPAAVGEEAGKQGREADGEGYGQVAAAGVCIGCAAWR